MMNHCYRFYCILVFICAVTTAHAAIPKPLIPVCAQSSTFPAVNLGDGNADAKAKVLNAAADKCNGYDKSVLKQYANVCQDAKGSKNDSADRANCNKYYAGLYVSARWCGYSAQPVNTSWQDKASALMVIINSRVCSSSENYELGQAVLSAFVQCQLDFQGKPNNADECSASFMAITNRCIPKVGYNANDPYNYNFYFKKSPTNPAVLDTPYCPPGDWGDVEVGKSKPSYK